MDRTELMNILPHREGMLLLDEAEKAGEEARGRLRIRGDEWFLQGHFPGNPVVPGVVQCEIIAQASCTLLKDAMQGCTPYYAGIDKVRFKRPVRPGETLCVTSTLLRSKMGVYVVAGEARVNGELCAKGEFTFMLVKNQ